MTSIDLTIRQIYRKIATKGLDVPSSVAYRQARKYVNSLSKEDLELLQEKGVEGYKSGDAFVNKIIESITANIENEVQAKNLEHDASLFSKSMEEIQKMDLSEEAINKALSESQEINETDAVDENGENGETQETEMATDADSGIALLSEDENDDIFLSVMSALYEDDVIRNIMDTDGDNSISNEEAQEFLKNLNIDTDIDNFSMNDIRDFFNKINGLQTEAEEWAQLEKESIDRGQGPADLSSFGGGGIASNPYVSPSYGSYSPSYGSDGRINGGSQTGSMAPKKDLEQQIEEYKQQIADVNSGKDSEIQSMQETAETYKENMNKAIEEDEKLTEEQKEQAKELMENLAEVDSQISDVDSQITSLQQELSSGEANLSMLEASMSSLDSAAPSTGDPQKDQEVKDRIEERKKELQTQIDEQKAKNEEIQEQITALEEQKATLEEKKTALEQGGEEVEMSLEQLKEMASEKTNQAIEAYQEQTQAVTDRKAEKVAAITEDLNAAEAQLREIQTVENQQKDQQAQNTFDASFEEMLAFVLGVEGGFSNDPDDRGGATNLGITQGTYNSWLASQGLPNKDVRYITLEEAKTIYYNNYFKASGAERYMQEGNVAYAFALFDASVNHGVGGASSIDKQAQGDLETFLEVRAQKYRNIIANNPSQAKFRNGWQNRLNKLARELGLEGNYTI